MSAYNLNDNVSDHFEFILGGHTYKMKYPTVEETEQVQDALKKAQESNNNESVLKIMFQFISSDDKEAPSFDEAIKKQNIKVIQNFSQMIEAEFKAS